MLIYSQLLKLISTFQGNIACIFIDTVYHTHTSKRAIALSLIILKFVEAIAFQRITCFNS
ncbi:hypothetical protein H6G81_28580 [Scytonema hofmannii FACHB-248]|uniref:Uncharacterized protein n=1 Tax=Scytonema hofmannii FACHB-248 TaxID=1842502 RepID=A0ABR8H010_9CYAN|nr:MULTISPECIES: hypothetical protein [Nostocales]MBD2608368.1 hypothetical protein [Scytonema hofmannii FACHB-248]